MGRKEGRDGPKWPAPAKIRGDRVQGRKMDEIGTNERAEPDLNGRKWEKVGRTKGQRRT